MAKLEAKKASAKYQKSQEKEEAMKIADKLSKILLKVKVKAGENGKIFGGVSSKDIAQELSKQYMIEIDKKKIDLKRNDKDTWYSQYWNKIVRGVIGKIRIDVISE